MLNKIWPAFIIISIIYALLTGNIDKVNSSIFDYGSSAVQLSITFLGTICVWNGIIKIIYKTTLLEKLTKVLFPIMKGFFPELKREEDAYKEISMNLMANMLGLGNAATPLGLKAMKSLQEKNSNKEVLSDSMIMFIVLNTASLQLIPTTVIAIRISLGSQNPTAIVLPVLISTIASLIFGIILTKICLRKSSY